MSNGCHISTSKTKLFFQPFFRACFINRYGLKLGSLHEDFALMNFLYEQEAIGAVERCAVGDD